MLISSSDDKERSWESKNLHNGIFTYYFLEGLVHRQSRVKRAVEYANPLMQQAVKSLKDVQDEERKYGVDINQRPQTMGNPPDADVALAPGG